MIRNVNKPQVQKFGDWWICYFPVQDRTRPRPFNIWATQSAAVRAALNWWTRERMLEGLNSEHLKERRKLECQY